jgi:hypothetical protein
VNKSFLKSMGFDDAILIDARFGDCPVAIAEAVLGKPKPKRQRPAKRWNWEDCRNLAAILNVMLGHDSILFESGLTSFENGKAYSYRNPTQCYEALLSLQRDRLARLSDAEAIADGIAAKEQII